MNKIWPTFNPAYPIVHSQEVVAFIFPPFSPIAMNIDAKFVAKICKNSQFPLRKSRGFQKMGLKTLGSQERGEKWHNHGKEKK